MRSRDAGELPYSRYLLARRLIVLEQALLDYQPLIRWNAFVIPRHAAERPLLRAIRLHVHDGRAIAQLADHLLWRRHEAGARVVRLFADCTIELGGVADRLVNRQPQV